MKLKKLLALCLVFVMLFAVVGCDSIEKDGKSSSKKDKESVEEKDDGMVTVYLLEKATSIDYDGEYVIQYDYDDNGNMILDDRDYCETYKYTYNSDNQVIRATLSEGPNGEGYIEYQYNDEGFLLAEITFYGDTEWNRIEYEYDDAGRRIIAGAKYDSKGNLIKTGDDSSLHDIYEYDDQNRLVKHEFVLNGNFKEYAYEYKYNDAGNIIEEICCVKENSTTVTKYEYKDKPYPSVAKTTDDEGVTSETKLQYREITLTRERAEELWEKHNDLYDLYANPVMVIIAD